MVNVRKAVITGLIRVEENGYSNLLLNSVLQEVGSEQKSRSFAVHLFYGTLERRYTLDAVLNLFLKKHIETLDIEIRNNLRCALFQVFFMNSVPIAVAINEAVELCRAFKKSSASGLVNAVLRNAAKHGMVTNFTTEKERLHIQYSVNMPIIELLLAQYNEECESILQSFFEEPQTTIRINTLKTNKKTLINDFKKLQIHVEESKIENALVLYYRGDITKLAPFQEGLFHVQGEASQWCIQVAGAKPYDKVIDLCAAPGGKSATVAQYMGNTGVLISADISEGRLKLTEGLLKRVGVENAVLFQNDAKVYTENFQEADVVLCDVPCSGIGIISKKPDIRFKALNDIEELYALQRNILQTAAKYVKIGGRLVYSTCTINKEENEKIIEDFLLTNTKFELTEPNCPVEGAVHSKFGTILLPNRTKTDGFFVAVMERIW